MLMMETCMAFQLSKKEFITEQVQRSVFYNVLLMIEGTHCHTLSTTRPSKDLLLLISVFVLHLSDHWHILHDNGIIFPSMLNVLPWKFN